MNRPIRVFALVALATALAACSQADGSIGDAPAGSPTAVPSLSYPTPEPTTSPSRSAPPATAVPSASPVTTPSPTEPVVDSAIVLAAAGFDPYLVGLQMSELKSRGLITSIGSSFHCDESWQHAGATGRFADVVALTFHDGRVSDISTHSIEIVTPSGARVGMALTELQKIYGSRGTVVNGTMGNQAFSVGVPDTALGIVFFLDDTNTRTVSMSAGELQRLEEFVVNGEGC